MGHAWVAKDDHLNRVDMNVKIIFGITDKFVCFVALRPSQQLWSLQDCQFT